MSFQRTRREFLAGAAALASAGILTSPHWAKAVQSSSGKANLLVRSADPFNAEPKLAALTRHELTPVGEFYVRNHGSMPDLAAANFKLRIEGLVRRPGEWALGELGERFRQHTQVATLTCAGNRRQELSAIRPVAGVQWDAGAIGTANWAGAALGDLIRAAEPETSARHVWFEGLDQVKEKDGSVAPFGGSIPIGKALEANSPALLATAMNGGPLAKEHGYPVRMVVPGYIGARSVKWLTKITISDRPSPNHYVAEAYKLVHTEDKGQLAAAGPLYTFSVNAAICSPGDGDKLRPGSVSVFGYALPTGLPDCQLASVEVSHDDGQTWSPGALQGEARPYAWQFWTAQMELPVGKHQLVVRATDSRGYSTPERPSWNLKGYLNNAWHRVSVEVS